MVLAKGRSITPPPDQGGSVHLDEEGGRNTLIFKAIDRSFTPDDGRDGSDGFARGTEMVIPGDNVPLVIELITPVAIEKGLRFAIREGGHAVGTGTSQRDYSVAVVMWERPPQPN